MITVGSIDSIRNLPSAALSGAMLIFFYTIAILTFLIPSALGAAGLASGWSEEGGGIYSWVKAAFGARTGFVAVWFQWVEGIFWFPAILAFVAGTVSYVVAPHSIENRWLLIATVIITYWGTTIVNLYGMQASAAFSSFCGLVGLILPMVIIIGLGAAWCLGNRPRQIHFHLHNILPHQGLHMWVSLVAVILSLCGMEIAAVHSRDTKDPQRAFPKALAISTLIIASTLMFASLAIAIVIPQHKISLIAGIMQAFSYFFYSYHLIWLMPLLTTLIVIGCMGSVSNWIIGLTKGMLVAAKDGNLPARFTVTNAQGAPTSLLLTQGVVVTLFTSVFIIMPSINGAFWLLTVLATQLYMVMYFLMFVSVIYLRYKNPTQQRLFKIPGGVVGCWIVSGLGIVSCVITIIVGFIPPTNINVGSAEHYDLLIILGLLLMSLPPFILPQLVSVGLNLRGVKHG